ncbi:MAG: hypothetical protein J6V72_09185 [Kiritimatiellae bacterium]|nr:hypothetical protein [Kiritimatiellia bacterium]
MSKIVKTCDFCGKEFTAHRVDQHLCSRKCHDAYHHAQRAAKRAAKRAETKSAIVKEMGEVLLFKCENCGREFTRERTKTSYRTKYCSERCSKEAHARQHREFDKRVAAICNSVPVSENSRFPSDWMCSALEGVMRKYPVLTADEEKEIMQKAPEQCRDLLLLHHVRLVYGMVKSWPCRIRFMDADDMVQIGLIALTEAARTFQLNGKSRFSQYARRAIENRFKMELRHSYLLVDGMCDSLNRKVDSVSEEGEDCGELLDVVQPLIVDEFRETSLAEWLEYRDGIAFAARVARANEKKHRVRRVCANAS